MKGKFLLAVISVAVVVALAVFLVACNDGAVGMATATTAPTAAAEAPVVTDAPQADLSEEGLPKVATAEQPPATPAEVPEELKIVWEAWDYLTRDYVDRSTLDPAKLSEAAVRGMLAALEDPHTSYVSPDAFLVDANDIFEGQFEGIGAHVQMNRAGKLVIVAPIPGSPAEAAGIRPGDLILAVDGKGIEGLSLLEAVAVIRGPSGSPVRLLVKHLGAIDPVEIEIIRGVVPLDSVLLRSQPGDRIAHVRLSNFYPQTANELVDIVLKAIGQGAEGLILDVRDNPGGLLSSVIDVTSQFVGEGLIMYQIDGSGARTNQNVRAGGRLVDIPMVVLVNEYSASASEVLVGALQDHRRAVVIGANTFGKGSVNILRPLSNGGGVWITTSRWYTPLGRLIHESGLKPDIEVVSHERRDADIKQLEKAFEVLGEQLGTLG